MGQFFNDLQVCASEKSNSKYLNDVLPYDTVNDIKPYSPQYISGFQAEKYAWRGDACFRLAERMIKDALESQARDSILAMGYDQAQVLEVQFSCSNVTYKHVLLPLWSAVFSHKGKLYQYLINGETGKVSGGRPYSAPKIVAAVLAAIAVLAGLYFLIESAGAYAAEYHPPAAQSQAQQVDLAESGSPAGNPVPGFRFRRCGDENKGGCLNNSEACKDDFQKGRKERSRLTAAFEGQSLGSRPAVTAGKQLSRRAVRKTGCEQNSDKMRKGAVQPGNRPVKGVGRVRTIQGFYTLKPFDGGRLLSACSASGKPGDYDVFLSVNPCAAQKPVRKNYKIGKGRKTAYGMVWTRQGHHRMERVSG